MQQAVMLNSSPQDAYRRQGVLTASPGELVVILYDALKKNLVLGQRKMDRRDVQGAHNCLTKAQAIVNELVGSLNMSFQISADLLELYDFMLRSIVEANVRKEPALLDTVIGMVDELRDAWKQISASTSGGLHIEDEEA